MKKIIASLALALFATASIAQNLPSPSFNNVTINGNLNLPSKGANTVMAAPSSGAGAPTFRTLAEIDIPALTVAKISGLQGILDGKASIASPAFTGVPTGPTAAVGTNNTQLATTAFVRQNTGSPTNMVTTDTAQTITGEKTFSAVLVAQRVYSNGMSVSDLGTGGQVIIGNDSNGAVRVGQSGRASAGTPYIDFYSAAGSSNYGARFIVTGGTTAGASANVDINSGGLYVNSLMRTTGLASLNGGATVPNTLLSDNNTAVANTAAVWDRQRKIDPIQYGAFCDGATDSSAAFNVAKTAAENGGVPLSITCFMRLSADVGTVANVNFGPAGRLVPDAGKTVYLSGQINAARTTQIFGGSGNISLQGNGYEVSACWFGACDGSSDVADDLRWLFNSNMNGKTIFFPPFNYNLCSQIPVGTSAYVNAGRGSGQVGYAATNGSNVILKQIDGFKVEAVGATFTTACDASAQNIAFLIDRATNWEWRGGSFIGRRTGLSAATVNAPFQLMNTQRGKLHQTNAVSGYFDNGAFFEGTFNRDLIIEDNIGVVGQGIDMAFVVNGVYRNNQFTGASSDTANIGFKCFSQIYDGPSVGGNTIGVGDSENVHVIGNKCDNYQTGIVLQNGKHYRITDNYLLNIKGGTGNPAAAILINYVPSGSFQTVGRPVWNVSINGNHIDGLGTNNAGCGVSFGGNAIANSDSLNRFSINGNMFSGTSGSFAVCADTNSLAKVNNLFVGSNEWSNVGAFFNSNAASLRRSNP